MKPHTKKKLGVWLSAAGVLLALAVYGGFYAAAFSLPMPLPAFLLLEGLVFTAGLGADAVVNVRYASSAVVQGAAEVIAYGTAVKFR